MVCERCGETVDVSGRFPGASVRCSCGAEGRVPYVPLRRTEAESPYRRPTTRAPRVPEATLPCPRCRAALEAIASAAEGERSYGCDRCRGVFLETGALEALRENRSPPPPHDLAHEAPPERVSTERYVHCPRCHEIMNRTVFGEHSGVVVDACSAHGVWFDRGELERVLRFVADGGLERVGRSPAAAKGERKAQLERAAAEAHVALIGETAFDLERERRALQLSSWLLFDLLEVLGVGGRRG